MTRRMLVTAVLAALPTVVGAAGAPTTRVELEGVSGYRRFLIHPHLERGFAALARGDHPAAIASLERARSHAPRNVLTALYLADAYRRAGRQADAARVLATQSRHTPHDPRLLTAIGRAAAPRRPAHPTRVARAANALDTPPRDRPRPGAEDPGPASVRPAQTRTAARRTARPQAQQRADRAPSPEDAMDSALRTGRIDDAVLAARTALATSSDDALLDRVSYRLHQAGARDAAAELLLARWPFGARHRELLTARLASLLMDSPGRASPDARRRLTEAGSGGDRADAARLLAILHDCNALSALMDRADGPLPAEAWAAHAECLRPSDSTAAIDAYRRAIDAGAGDEVRLSLAYAAAAAGDNATALAAWSAVSAASLSGTQLLAAATTAVAAGDPAKASAWLDLHARQHPADDTYWWLRSQLARGDALLERAALERALSKRDDARYLVRLAELQRHAGQPREAVRSLERARVLAPDDLTVAAALGYAYVAVGDDAAAKPLLASYQASNPTSANAAEDLAGIHRRLSEPESARAMARTALDLLDGGAEPARVFRLRRLHEDLGRRWATSLDVTLGNRVAGTNAAIPGSAYRGYGQIETQYRLGHDIGRPDGDALSVYGRLFAGAESGGPLPDDRPTLGVGVRWKPFPNRIAYVAVEQQAPLDGDGRGDTLVRVSASPLTDPTLDRDWHPSGSGWWSHTIYLDAAHYLGRGDSAFTADYQAGRHFKISPGQTIEPFGRVQANGLVRGGGFDRDVRIGLGMRWNLWYGGDRYTAWPHRLVVGAELQHAPDTHLPERRTFFVNVGSHW